jgi:hypothetical protein
MSRVALILLSGLWLAAPLEAGADLTEGAIAPPGECARAPELPPPAPARSPISALFPPVDVAAGSSSGSAAGAGAAAAGQPGSSNPGRPSARGFAGRDACDDPGSGCAGAASLSSAIPPGGVLQPDGWIRFPDGSLLPPQNPNSGPVGTP